MSDKGFRKTIALTGFLLVMLSVVFAKGGGEVPAEGGDRIPDLPDNPIERLEQYFAEPADAIEGRYAAYFFPRRFLSWIYSRSPTGLVSSR
jgi:hypothetical protein